MIRIGFALLVACAATVARAGDAASPSLQAKALVYDAGKVTRGVKLAHTFLLRNVGPVELSVDAKPG